MAGEVSSTNLPYATKYNKDNYMQCSKCSKQTVMEELLLGFRELCQTAGKYTDRWYHVVCFFAAMKSKGVGVHEAAIRGMSWLKWHDQETIRAHIDNYNQQATGGSSSKRHFLSSCKAEHAKSARGKCGTCGQNIPQGEAKYFCKGAYHHLACFMGGEAVYVGTIESIQGYAALKQEAKDALKAAYDAHVLRKNVKAEKIADVKTEADASGSSATTTMGNTFGSSTATSSGGEAAVAGVSGGAVDPLLEAARKLARAQKKDEIVLGLDSSPEDAAGAGAAMEEDDEIEVLEVVQSEKPPVVTIGVLDTAPPPKPIDPPSHEVLAAEAKPKSSLNDYFAKFQKSGASTSLSSVMETIAKKPRLDEQMGKEQLSKQLEKQANALWALREAFENVRDNDIEQLMRSNDMYVPTDSDREKLVMSIADAALFGAPGQCPKCPDGRLIYNADLNTYTCMGNVTEWTKCTHVDGNPTRCPIGIPRALSRHMAGVEATGVMNSMTRRFYPTAAGSETMTKVLPTVAVTAELTEGEMNKAAGLAAASAAGKQFIKKGTVVDGECTYASVAHVYRDDEGTLFSCSLTQADMATNRNSYFKMQLLQHDTESDRYFVFKSWGRVGTELGGSETQPYYSLSPAKSDFLSTFADKTGNDWADKKYFRKRAGKMAMVDMDYSEIERDKTDGVVEPGSLTKLEKPVQQLILRIFDENMFKSALKSFDLDMDQMPLGKLSKRQLERAYGVLNELNALMASSSPSRSSLIDASNRFYSLIPHNFGHKPPVVLDTKEIVEKKSKLIENLMDIAIAVDLMKGDDRMGVKMGVTAQDPIDVHYLKLKSEISVLPASHPDYRMIEKYAKHTHGSTHGIKIKITDIFKVNREGEDARFKSALGNRMLLWHGSRLSNFVGIISQGLRIAPPEAPHAGYMFGKGIYFADMISKSANYCHPDSLNDAFLLLCDVALGTVQEETNATSVNPLKNGATSVKGMGNQYPDPTSTYIHPDGFVVPNGKTTKGLQRIYLEYNEYIVYDVAQVRIRYLVRTKMNWR